MAVITKTDNLTILALQSVAASGVVVGTPLDVASKLAAFIGVHFGRRAAAAAGAGVNIRIEGSTHPTKHGYWSPLAIFTTDFVACEAEAVSGTVAAGTNIITVASTTNLTAADLVFLDNGTIGNSEWGRVKSIVGATSITIEDNLENAQTSATIYDRAEFYSVGLDVTHLKRIRAVADGSGFTQAFAIRVMAVTGDSIG